MEKTTITIDMDKESLREGMTRIIEYITMTLPDMEELDSKQRLEYNLGLSALFACLRQTF